MLDHDAEESGPRVLTTLSLFGKHGIDLAGDLEGLQEPNDRIARHLKERMRSEVRGSL